MIALSILTSGMTTAAQRQAVTAHNIANLATPGFRAMRADSVELQGGGTALGSITADPTPPPFIESGLQGSNVNLIVEMVNTILNRNAFLANANAFRSQSDTVGELLDLSR